MKKRLKIWESSLKFEFKKIDFYISLIYFFSGFLRI